MHVVHVHMVVVRVLCMWTLVAVHCGASAVYVDLLVAHLQISVVQALCM